MPKTGKQISGDVYPGGDQLMVSGGDSSVSSLDWYVHTQIAEAMYIRKVQYDTTVSSPLTQPTTQYNYVDVHYSIQCIDEVWEDATFSGEAQNLQTLEIINAAVSGGLGLSGVVNTSTAGYIRRPVRKDAQGNILDPTGICQVEGNFIVDQAPGTYEPVFDTSTNLNSNIARLVGHWGSRCPTFMSTLVDI